jgi:hypothetical protein
MLKNELYLIEKWSLHTQSPSNDAIDNNEWNARFFHIQKVWESAAYSEIPNHTLVRYFHHQLEGISDFSDNLSGLPFSNEAGQTFLLRLIDHLMVYYKPYFNWEKNAPAAYQRRLTAQIKSRTALLKADLLSSAIDSLLRDCLIKWLNEISDNSTGTHYNFRGLNYFNQLIAQLSAVDLTTKNAEVQLLELLLRFNFNHLAFLVCRQQMITEKINRLPNAALRLAFLQQQKADVSGAAEIGDTGYDFTWPSLKGMLSGWLQEQIILRDIEAKRDQELKTTCSFQKQSLELSVAQLACLIRLFTEENIFVSKNIKSIFQFFAAHYQTKRQAVISAGSLSKEFYSIDQHTAARVKDMLQKMVTRINRNFFPVAAVTGTAILFDLSMR